MTKTEVKDTNGIECTIKAGKHFHDRRIEITTRRRFNRAVHEIATMLTRWRKRGKVRTKQVEFFMAGARLVVTITRNVQELGRRIRNEFLKEGIVSFN